MALTSKETFDLARQVLTGNYVRAPLSIVRGQGSYVWDAEGKRYLDLLPGLGVNGLGHCPPRVVEALRQQAGELLHIHNNYLIESQARLAQKLIQHATGMGEAKAFFCNSGTEASECAIKMARLWGKQNGGKWKFITLENGFHGRTYGALSATGQTNLHKGCEPLLPGFVHVPINDAKALEQAFQDKEVAAFIVEPVQGEGGIFSCTPEYLQTASALCDWHGALLLYDEVQAGMGRTGDLYAYQTLGAPAPDVLWLAKALGGGFPIGAVLARADACEFMVPGTHGSTFGGNPLACAAGLAVLETIEQEGLLAQVRETGVHLGKGLDALKQRFPKLVLATRRVGLMAAIDLSVPGKAYLEKCRDKGLLINCTHDTVLRLLPAMNVTCAQLDEGLSIITEVLKEQA